MDAKGCMARDSAIVNVYPVLLLAHTPDALVCAGTPTAIGQNATGGTAPLLYAWSPPNGLSSTSVAMPSATPASSTTYVETVTDANGCKARDTVFVTVAPSLTFSLGADQTVCAGSDVLLSPQGAIPSDANYVWKNLTTGATEGATRNITVRADSNSTHELRIVSGSCLARDTVQITVHPNPLATISVSADTLIASAGSSYQWAMDTTTIRGATSRTLVPHATGSYSVEVFDAFGCHSRSASVDVKELGVSAQQLATSIRIVPNPTHGIVTAFLPEGEHCLSAYASAILGQRWPLELRTRGENGWQIDLRTLAPGSYFLHVVTSAGEHLVKVIRE
jgi:hypothetical protein